MSNVKEMIEGPRTQVGIQSTLDYLLNEIERHKAVITLLEQECATLYAKLKQLEKEKEQ